MNLQNNQGNVNLLFVDEKFCQKKRKRLHVALENISKLKKNGGGSNRTGMKFDEHASLSLSLSSPTAFKGSRGIVTTQTANCKEMDV